MLSKLLLFVLFSVLVTVSCKSLEGAENATTSVLSVAEGLFRTGRAHKNLIYANLLSCAIRYDTACFVDAAGEYFQQKKNELLAQADAAVLRSTGRADPENTPSNVAKSIEKLFTELSAIFKDSLLNFFNGAKEAEDDDEVVDPDDKTSDDSRMAHHQGEARKKKKKKPIKSLIYVIKIGIIAAVVATKIGILLKAIETALKFKFLLIAAGTFAIYVAKFWLDLKSNKQDHDEGAFVYKNPYDQGGVDWGSGGPPPGEYNARNYNILKEQGQNLAYKRYKPV